MLRIGKKKKKKHDTLKPAVSLFMGKPYDSRLIKYAA